MTLNCLKPPALSPLLNPTVLTAQSVFDCVDSLNVFHCLCCASSVGKPVLHMKHTCSGEPAAQRSGALARPSSNNMPLSEHDAQELRRMLYLRAEGIERQERLQYLRQTWKSCIWSEEDDEP